MKTILIMLTLLLVSCGNEKLYYNDAIVKEIKTTGGSCSIKVSSMVGTTNSGKTFVKSISHIYHCPCNKWKIGDTVKFN